MNGSSQNNIAQMKVLIGVAVRDSAAIRGEVVVAGERTGRIGIGHKEGIVLELLKLLGAGPLGRWRDTQERPGKVAT